MHVQESKASTLSSQSLSDIPEGAEKDAKDTGNAKVWAIFPPNEGKLDLGDFAPIVYAQQDMANAPFGSSEEEVNVVIDEEVEDQVVELLGDKANLGFAFNGMEFPYVVLQLQSLGKYVRFEIGVIDTQDREYLIRIKNNQSLVRIKRTSCSLPLRLHKGWNRICIDLRDVVQHAFGAEFKAAITFRIFANCRLWRLFFQGEDYADDQLPEYLRVIMPMD